MSSGTATVAIAMALIVMYDASHVRYQVGKHAHEINRLKLSSACVSDIENPSKTRRHTQEVSKEEETAPLVNMQITKDYTFNDGIAAANNMAKIFLEEAVGHTKLEVVAGALCGVSWFALALPILMWD